MKGDLGGEVREAVVLALAFAAVVALLFLTADSCTLTFASK
jgi:hypothetical protein